MISPVLTFRNSEILKFCAWLIFVISRLFTHIQFRDPLNFKGIDSNDKQTKAKETQKNKKQRLSVRLHPGYKIWQIHSDILFQISFWLTTFAHYSFKVNNENTRTMCKTCLKLSIKTPERHHWLRHCIFIVNLSKFHTLFWGSGVDLEQVNVGWLAASISEF